MSWGGYIQLLALFAISQSLYFVVNVLLVAFLFARPSNVVTDGEPTDYPTIHVLLPIYRERVDVLSETLAGIIDQTYPTDRIRIHVIHETDDDIAEAVTALREVVAGDTLSFLEVDRARLANALSTAAIPVDAVHTPRTKAAALSYAYDALTLPPDDVVTVFDSDTLVPDDLFALAVAALERYDIVQAKQTVRNVADGWLPALESAGIAAWCHTVYVHTTRGPYQLLGKAYFVRVGTLDRLDGWEATAATEDMALGVAASITGLELAVLDRYVQDLCPAAFTDWVRQKRRWVRGPYQHLLHPAFDWGDRTRFWVFTVANQIVAVTNVVTVPVGIATFVVLVTVDVPPLPPALRAIVAINFVCWAYYSLKAYRATTAAVTIDSPLRRVWYYLTVNPLTEVIYATLWVVPILAAGWDVLRGREPTFDVTPK